jgi:Domain of unknown function (DUF1998)
VTLRAGALRPSQAISQSGPGSLVDLPTLSMVMAGLDNWNLSNSARVDEPRLARLLRVDTFREPPYLRSSDGSGGLPARLFPTFLVCPRCNRLAPYSAFHLEPGRAEFRCDSATCKGKGRALAYPARYMVACSRGHLSDFPWHAYLHPTDVVCKSELRLEDTGRTGAITDLWIKCPMHGLSKNLGQAFGAAGRARLPRCSAERPWLGDRDPAGCSEQPRVLLRGASNAYFPVVASAISIPPWSDPIQVALGGFADLLAKVDSLEKLKQWFEITNAPELTEYPAEQVWEALVRRRTGAEVDYRDLREEEWRAFQTKAVKFDPKTEFLTRTLEVPSALEDLLSGVLVVERLREVRALRGFTRIDPLPDIGDLGEVEAVQAGLAPLRRIKGSWLPGVDFRGEGILLKLDRNRIGAWESRPEVKAAADRQRREDEAWHRARALKFTHRRPIRYTLLHTLSHLLLRQLALDSGYSSASLRERLYCSASDLDMLGILIYTATSDSEGSLGGLAEQARADILGPLVTRSLLDARVCANDPLCADHEARPGTAELNSAACHACLLVSETACEAGNHYLDRGLLVRTIRNADTAFVAA